MQLFDKCRQFTKAREVQAAGLYPYFKPISDSEDTAVVIEGQKRIMLGSNNYLGLTHHPKVLEAASRALHRYGSGCTGSRFLNGTLDLHGQLEAALAEFLGKEDCLVFSTGYQANLGLISGLIGRGDLVYLDKLDHASIVDGAKMSYGDTLRFSHGDLAGLDRMIERTRNNRGAMIVVDGVYSMEGDIANVPELVRIARKHGVALALDDAHSLGVLGPNGDGTAAHFGMTDEVDLIAGTFSKSLASIGGFVAGSENVIHFLKHHSRPLIFTASLPPANTAGVLAALEVLRSEPERRTLLWANTHRFINGMRDLGYNIGETETPIIPVLIGPMETTFVFWRKLYDAGVFTNPVMPPAVPPSQCRLRTSLMATHTFDQIDYCLEQFASIGKALGVI
ncbi:MAG: pyridoxal phosphate-dependent aminotransferase family protein [Gemmatimonadetes bacterium]|nr:pyridoxal phosphate-dependent aminotransferase family protein [Gemmatimonadota bacterium]MBK7350370.1 pyridoxal phosphate-dependent aminotransferase family protein [Gemmatimonadota bacterium]MBK7716377.1 pyridoxal phosphate-dependent aminotransferase family protein [Gemmatimonadota bacterium]MBK7785513.1 pyridoxal phosphate-dependent aminotransferase family protein [Gemmatimonadota bacterium]MBK7923609.1 pyridoxal phosphate-dependent aminotransferase family protein [Gemmatimonadota bacterium